PFAVATMVPHIPGVQALPEVLPAEPVARTTAPAPPPIIVRPRMQQPSRQGSGVLLMLVPIAFLVLGLGGVVARDLLRKPLSPPPIVNNGGPDDEVINPEPLIALLFHNTQENVKLGDGGVKPEDNKPVGKG